MDTYTSFNDLTVSQEVKRKVATFDMTTKRFLAQKDNLAQLLKSCIAEYGCYDPESIAGNFIEPNIAVASTEVFPSIHGMPTEDITPEGDRVTFDILFDATLPNDKGKVGVIVNVETQQVTSGLPYKLFDRMLTYSARIFVSPPNQKVGADKYVNLKKVFSIWVCPTNKHGNNILLYNINRSAVLGGVPDDGEDYDMMRIYKVELGIPVEGNPDFLNLASYIVHPRLITSEVVRNYPNFFASYTTGGGVADMCNLGMGIYQEGREDGMKDGIEKGMKDGIEKGMKDGIEKGIEKGQIELIRNFMRYGNLDAKQSMDILGIPLDVQSNYAPYLA